MMQGVAATAALGAGLFAVTNLDDLILLVAFAAEGSIPPWRVVAGQYAGIAALVATSALAASAARALPAAWLGLLGAVPIAIGLRALWRRDAATLADDNPATSGGGAMRVTAVTIANGGDNLATYTPVFAARPIVDLVLIGLVFIVMTGLWCLAAYRLAGHPAWREPLQRAATTILPYALVALGCLILGRSLWPWG